ncbi:MAG: trypsin-like peptidase domain-containing protein [bacterium]|nr:trypsin-like peptidase domain-containing protein [bacterium]
MQRILIIVLLLAALPALAAVPTALDNEADLAKAELALVPVMDLAMPDLDDLALEDAARHAEGLPFRYAVPADVALTPGNSGLWTDSGDRRVWRLRVATPGATTLNLGFVHFGLPASGRLAVYPAADRTAGLAWDRDDVADHGQLWTPALATDELVVEVTVDADEAHLVDLELGRIGRGYRGFAARTEADKSGACNIDVVCVEGDPWREEIKSVGGVSQGGTIYCTGALINNTDRDGRPLFLTANHCGISDLNASTVVIYWNYESAGCGDHGGGALDQSQAGSTLLARWSGTDFTLIELDDVPDAAFDVRWAGWDRRDRNNDASVAIHHPRGDEKSISLDEDPTTITTYAFTPVPGDGSHLRVGAWESGTTEDGSSGSPLFNEAHRITGQLHGGYASCDDLDRSDWYGRLAVSWEGGGDAATRLRDHLDPSATGAEFLGTLGAGLDLSPQAPAAFQGRAGGPFVPESATYSIVNGTIEDLGYAVELAGAGDWFQVVTVAGDIPAGGNRNLTIEPSATAANLVAGTYTGQVRILDGAGGALHFEIEVSMAVRGRGVDLDAIAPNPSRGLAIIHYHVSHAGPVHGRVYDLRGLLVADLGAWTPEFAGENSFEWAARATGGGHLPSGVYVFELEGGGTTSRQRFAIVR